MAILGYARVSTDGQSLAAQIEQLKATGCERIFREKVSGARTDRRELAKLLHALGVRFGRPPKLNPHQRREAIERLKAGETQADIARTYGVDPTTIGRLDCALEGTTAAIAC